ncbi:exosome non-catalytic core subunit rrp40 [Tulasnella sp. 418]|nr:exosome non-catalytic core subunit rrp40 [Tulasnella sp. 418]
MINFVMDLIFPGDSIPIPQTAEKGLKLGPGLIHVPETQSIVSTKVGVLGKNKKGNQLWVESNATRYSPAGQEPVIGVVIGRNSDGYRIDIGGAHTASLDALAFESATKRNRPNIKVGALVYARVSLAHKDMEPELECFDATTRKAEGFGELKGGFLTKCSLGLCRRLFDPTYFLLPTLGSKFPMEVVIGVNGRVWVKTPELRHTIAIARCIEAVDEQQLDQEKTKRFLNSLDVV